MDDEITIAGLKSNMEYYVGLSIKHLSLYRATYEQACDLNRRIRELTDDNAGTDS